MKLKEIFDVFNGINILKYLTTNYAVPWKTGSKSITADEAEAFDYDYVYNHSGDKIISPILEVLKDKNYTDSQIQTAVCNILFRKYAENWTRVWDALVMAEYDPISNYDKNSTIENHKGSIDEVEESGQETTAYHKGVKVTDEMQGEETNEHHKGSQQVTQDTRTIKHTEDDSTYGANSAAATPKAKTETTDNVLAGALTIEEKDTDATHFDKDVTNFNNRKNVHTEEDIDANTYNKDEKSFNNRKTTTTHKDIDANTFDKVVEHTTGNIGVLTNQKMITEEKMLREESYFNYIYTTLDDVLTIPYYGG